MVVMAIVAALILGAVIYSVYFVVLSKKSKQQPPTPAQQAAQSMMGMMSLREGYQPSPEELAMIEARKEAETMAMRSRSEIAKQRQEEREARLRDLGL